VLAKARKRTMPPLLVSFTYYRTRKQGWITFENDRPEACAKAAARVGAIALGVNCGRDLGMKGIREIVRRYHDACDLPVFIRPNAGTPTKTATGWAYANGPEMMADQLGPLLEEGLAMVGGCCGTTPEHIWRFGLALDAWNATQDGGANSTARP
jgi:5-methyltetrahydrofolate--homocysteine methyltransferase